VTDPEAGRAVEQLAADYWTLRCELHPTHATAVGVRTHDDRLPDISPAGREEADRRLAGLQARAEAIDPEGLGGEDALTLSVLREAVAGERTRVAADALAYTVNVMAGPQSELLSIPSYQPLGGPDDGRALLARWRAMAPYLDEAIACLRRGAAEGRTPVGGSLDRVIEQLRVHMAGPLETWSLLAPLRANHDDWPEAEWRRFADQLFATVRDEVRPAFGRYLHACEEMRPHARDDERAGIGHLPGGAAIYVRQVAAHTTTRRRVEEIHEIGLAEVNRIDREMTELGRAVLGTATLAETQRALRTNPAVHFTTREEVREVAERSLRRAVAAIPAWFGRLPRAACEVVPMLAHEERHSTIAYYREPAADGSRPGRYYLNTSEPHTRPRYEAEALAFHEAVPGHHLQLAIGQELDGLPEFRRFAEITAFVEGWGLYTERLADEMGLYSGDLDRIGMLSFDAWRACRLVVDTGMHAMGWSRRRAIAFMVDHSALAENNIENEVDRYLGWPGQALAYKIGQLEIADLRAHAEQRLGSAFDIRRFHDAVLTHGALPLSTLRAVVARDLSV
jgi:uncharacterized protein (DUF885 family)